MIATFYQYWFHQCRCVLFPRDPLAYIQLKRMSDSKSITEDIYFCINSSQLNQVLYKSSVATGNILVRYQLEYRLFKHSSSRCSIICITSAETRIALGIVLKDTLLAVGTNDIGTVENS